MMDAENTKVDEERVTALENVQSNRMTGMKKKKNTAIQTDAAKIRNANIFNIT